MDTPALIGILDELDRPHLIDDILKLGHTLAIAGHVKPELRRSKVREGAEDMVRQGKIRIFAGSTATEMRRIREGFPGPGPGECDALPLHGRVRAQGRSYCTLDERRARSAARRLGIPFTGLLGLPGLLKERGIVDKREAGKIADGLRAPAFGCLRTLPYDPSRGPGTGRDRSRLG